MTAATTLRGAAEFVMGESVLVATALDPLKKAIRSQLLDAGFEKRGRKVIYETSELTWVVSLYGSPFGPQLRVHVEIVLKSALPNPPPLERSAPPDRNRSGIPP